MEKRTCGFHWALHVSYFVDEPDLGDVLNGESDEEVCLCRAMSKSMMDSVFHCTVKPKGYIRAKMQVIKTREV